ncbi:penicillin-binding protein 1B [Pantoea sp. S62]|nr:penicillin-binding protein 1B [Pantoea sp. S62]
MSFILNYRYPKSRILEFYLNEIFLGQNGSNSVYGFLLASYFYFGKPIGERLSKPASGGWVEFGDSTG